MVRTHYILGAGITGLTLGYELLKKGEHVVLLEKDQTVGGLAKSIQWKNYNLDLGPHIYHTPDEEISTYWETEFYNLFYKRVHWAKNFKHNKYYDYPISKEMIDKLPKKIKNKILQELNNTDNKELKKATNYYKYIKALVGPTLQKMFFTKYPEKLWGISVTQLDANWAPKRINIREKSTPFFWKQWSAVGINGSGTITESLKTKILELGGEIQTSEKIKKLKLKNAKIYKITTENRTITLNPQDIVINTTSYTKISKLLNIKTNLKYRGVILVFLEIKCKNIFPEMIDFIYIDDPKIIFNRISDQNSFLKKPIKDKTVICCEITYNKNDKYDKLSISKLIDITKKQVVELGFCNISNILDAKVVKLPEVYPMFFLDYEKELAKTKAQLDNIYNLYNLGSLAEYAYSDLQILFSKAIDFAEILTDKTFAINKIDKTTPRLQFNNPVKIKNIKIGTKYKTFVIAEIGLNHNGDIEQAKQLIDYAIQSEADAVKLQSYKSANRVSKTGKTSKYIEKTLGMEETDFELFAKNELTYLQTKELFEYARDKILIFSTPFDLISVDELESLNIDCYKIASFDLVNLPLIAKVAKTMKPIILSTGMANLSEIEEALSTILQYGNNNVILLHCTSSYPCPPENMNIKAIDTIKQAFQLPVGLSDHVIGDTVSLAAVARGADVIEKHFTLDKKMEGPDHILSLEPKELDLMIKRIRMIEESLGDGIKQASPNEYMTMIKYRKTMYSARKIKKGDKITQEDITYKGPAYGIYAKYEPIIIGQKAKQDIDYDEPITWEKITNE